MNDVVFRIALNTTVVYEQNQFDGKAEKHKKIKARLKRRIFHVPI